MPTYDHVLPIARGGKDMDENIVTTSMLMNSIKSNFLLEEIGFKVHDRGSITEWDGMIGWYKEYVDKNNIILDDNYVKQWHNALLRYEKEFGKP
ncbi:MAG: HNH endonuclease, partial [Spirochaetes bacterium]|nr:HNH endonuclease [Spirochaetota bacterium]